MATCECCAVPGAATPVTIENRPALSQIAYRVGTYASFRRAMLEAVARPEHERAPLAEWKTREADDYGITFLDMWAYLADILTFYQERIANEAYLRTARHDSSVDGLAGLIGYRPAPGKAAATHLAFTTEPDAEVELAAGTQVQSVPGQDEQPQKFETVEDVTAYAELNLLRPRLREPQELALGGRAAMDVKSAVFAGVDLALAPGDWIVIVGQERIEDPGSERWDVRRLATVAEDRAAGVTAVTWEDGLGSWYPPVNPVFPPAEPEVYVFRNQAWPFGYNAPDWRLLDSSIQSKFPEFLDGNDDPTDDGWNAKYLPEAEPEHLYLDGLYPRVVPGSWVAVSAPQIGESPHAGCTGFQRRRRYVELYRVVAAEDTAYLNYTLSAKVSRLELDVPDGATYPEHLQCFPLRGTTVLVQAEPLTLAEVPVATPVEGSRITLDAAYPGLEPGRKLLVAGVTTAGTPSAEVVEVELVDGADVVLDESLAGVYVADTVLIFGNVAAATHGETVATETLGDGDAAATFQTFALRKAPVTHVPKAGAPNGAASTLEVRVGGVRWRQVAELHGQTGADRAYVERRDEDEETFVRFGDGETGARVPSGRGNVIAAYRVGHGPEGNLAAGTLRTLLSRPVGLKEVTNPGPAAGGARAEDRRLARANAPGTVRTFGRIVSLRDYADAAREYIGIAKARATWDWDGETKVVDLVVAGDDGATVTDISALAADLDARRDRNRKLVIRGHRRVPIVIAAAVAVDPDHLPEDVAAAGDAAVRARLAFDEVDLGQTIHLSDVYGVLQGVPGVVAVDVDEFRFKSDTARRAARVGSAALLARVPIGRDQLAWVEAAGDVAIAARFELGGPR